AVTTHPSHFHQLGSSETYLNTPTSNKKLDFWEDWFMKAYSAEVVEQHVAFFDHWLKGIENGIMDKPPVRLEIRTGRGGSYVQEEHEWPVARTEYVRWYLDATPLDWKGNIRSDNVLCLARTVPGIEKSVSYSAEVELTAVRIPPASAGGEASMATAPCTPGATFLSQPLDRDMVLAGYSKLMLWVSSTSEDMDIFVALRVLDEENREVDFCGPALIPGISTEFYPLAKGWLKASHRRLDTARSTDFRPKHTHLRGDYAPLHNGEIVPVEVEIIPNTGLIRRGHRLRIDIQPYTGVGHGMRHGYDKAYHDGAQNTIFTGPKHPSYVQLPFLPPRGS
ncbi:MAG TPA: CocE/NonD family hydrolase, partial [Candidatus Acidoferrum sp.]|nr:CocE/NonD family hydrolase [Candidatus Acidoferrum sp.]